MEEEAQVQEQSAEQEGNSAQEQVAEQAAAQAHETNAAPAETKDDDAGDSATLFGKKKAVEKEKKDEAGPNTGKINYSRFKELFEDEDEGDYDDEKLFLKVSELKKLSNAKDYVLEWRSKLQENETYKNLNAANRLGDDELLLNHFVNNENFTAEDAKAEIEDLKDQNPRKYNATINSLRKAIGGAISNIEKEYHDKANEAAKLAQDAVSKRGASHSPEFLKEAVDGLSKMNTFLGVELGVDDEEKQEFFAPVSKKLQTGETLKRFLTDKEFAQKVAFLDAYEEQTAKSISKRFTPKREVIEKEFRDAPHVEPFAKQARAGEGGYKDFKLKTIRKGRG